jgi:hypothetical protein
MGGKRTVPPRLANDAFAPNAAVRSENAEVHCTAVYLLVRQTGEAQTAYPGLLISPPSKQARGEVSEFGE